MDQDQALHELQAPLQLTILDLSRPILNPQSPSIQKRTSDMSNASNQPFTSPALLAADLAHYRDLFTKLRFSYVEQVTKERFLKAITSDPPEFIAAGENAALEEKLREDKANLKARKEEVRVLIGELEEQGRSLASRYEMLQTGKAQLEDLPAAIERLEATIADLQSRQEPASSNPVLSLPLHPTLELLTQRERENAELDRQIAALRASIPAKQHDIERLQDELAPLHTRKIKAVQETEDAKRRKHDGSGIGDELEERGRWLRGVEAGLKRMLEV